MSHPLTEEFHQEVFRQLAKRTLVKHTEFLFDLGALLTGLLDEVVSLELDFFQQLLLFI